MKTDIILIGPIGTGKSTLGKMLAEHLALPQCSMDELRWGYYNEIGFSRDEEKRIWETEGMAGIYRYWKPFEIHAVERLLADHENCVIDFGAGHSVYEDPAQLERARQALAPYANVALVLPSPDIDESLAVLRTRTYNPGPNDFDFNALFVKHPSNRELATITVYTDGKTPEQTRDEILAALAR